MKSRLYLLSIALVFCFSCKRNTPEPPSTVNDPKPPKEPFITLLWQLGAPTLTEQPGPLHASGHTNLFVNAIANPGNTLKRVRIYWQSDINTETPVLDTTLAMGTESFSKMFTLFNFSQLNYTGTPNLMLRAVTYQDDGLNDTARLEVLKPSVNVYWHNGSGYTDKNGTIQFEKPLTIKLDARSSNGLLLNSFKVGVTVDGWEQSPVWDTILHNSNTAAFEREITSITLPKYTSGKVVVYFSATEGNNLSPGIDSFILNIDAGATIPKVHTDLGIQLEAQKHPGTKSFFNPNALAGGVMTKTQATATPAEVQIVYFNTSTFGATLSSPVSKTAEGFYLFMQQWNERNQTHFWRTKLNSFTFDKIGPQDYDKLKSECLKFIGTIEVFSLKPGEVVAWTNNNGTAYALLKITSIIPGDNGSITFDMKSPVF